MNLYQIYYISVALILLVSLLNFTRYTQSINFLKKTNTHHSPAITNIRHFVLIPVLREQSRIISTIEYFLKIMPQEEDISIIVCTTDKEASVTDLQNTTKEIVDSYILKNPSIPLLVCHYPYKNGGMAHQLNYTIKKYHAEGIINELDYISIYNADSRPHPKTYQWITSQLASHPDKHVFQQSAVFLRNYSLLNDYFAKAVALYQSCWTLTHEIPRLRRQASEKHVMHKWSNVHCVGHGLFIRFDILDKMGYFPVDTLTEDTYLGFKLRCAGITIHPVPYIETGDSPINMMSSLKQKYVWFWGPMLYPYYLYKYLQEENNGYFKFRSIILSAQGILNALRWIIVGPLILTTIFLPYVLSTGISTYIISIVSILLYISLPVLGIPYAINILEIASGQSLHQVREPWRRIPMNLFFGFLHSILHSIPPFFSLASAFRMIFTGRAPAKPKTDE